jgi:hypothetical protein
LEAIVQGDNESLRNYIERFNKEAVQVDTNDDMKKYLIECGLRRHNEFAKAIGIEPQATLNDLLNKATTFIDYEEKLATTAVRQPRTESSSGHNRGSSRGGGDRMPDDRPRDRNRGPISLHTTYTPLNASRE